MFLTHDMADAFGDWLECHRLRRTLIAALPELADAVNIDDHRPLLRIRRPVGDALIIARAADDSAGLWIVGIPDQPAPAVHDANSPEVVVGIVLGALGYPGADPFGDTADNAGE